MEVFHNSLLKWKIASMLDGMKINFNSIFSKSKIKYLFIQSLLSYFTIPFVYFVNLDKDWSRISLANLVLESFSELAHWNKLKSNASKITINNLSACLIMINVS